MDPNSIFDKVRAAYYMSWNRGPAPSSSDDSEFLADYAKFERTIEEDSRLLAQATAWLDEARRQGNPEEIAYDEKKVKYYTDIVEASREGLRRLISRHARTH